MAPTFYEFDIRVEGGIDIPSLTYHGGGHLGVGGDLGEVS
jgi:tyrosinase